MGQKKKYSQVWTSNKDLRTDKMNKIKNQSLKGSQAIILMGTTTKWADVRVGFFKSQISGHSL